MQYDQTGSRLHRHRRGPRASATHVRSRPAAEARFPLCSFSPESRQAAIVACASPESAATGICRTRIRMRSFEVRAVGSVARSDSGETQPLLTPLGRHGARHILAASAENSQT